MPKYNQDLMDDDDDYIEHEFGVDVSRDTGGVEKIKTRQRLVDDRPTVASKQHKSRGFRELRKNTRQVHE